MREVTASGRPATTPRGGVVPGQGELVIWAGHEPARFGTRDSYLSPSRTFLLVRHGRMKVQSLPFTGRPFIEAHRQDDQGPTQAGRCPSPGGPSLRLPGEGHCASGGGTLPFTRWPFVEATSWPGRSRRRTRVAALHRAALR